MLWRTVLAAAVCALPNGDPLREQWKKEFEADEDMALLADARKPKRRQKKDVRASVKRLQQGAAWKDEAFSDVSVFQELLPYFDVTKHTIYDLAHTFANVIKLLFSIIANKKNTKEAKFTKKVKHEEMKTRKRFDYLRSQGSLCTNTAFY